MKLVKAQRKEVACSVDLELGKHWKETRELLCRWCIRELGDNSPAYRLYAQWCDGVNANPGAKEKLEQEAVEDWKPQPSEFVWPQDSGVELTEPVPSWRSRSMSPPTVDRWRRFEVEVNEASAAAATAVEEVMVDIRLISDRTLSELRHAVVAEDRRRFT